MNNMEIWILIKDNQYNRTQAEWQNSYLAKHRKINKEGMK